MLAFANHLRDRGTGLRALNLGGGDVDTSAPMGSQMFTVMAALAQTDLDFKRERINASLRQCLGGCRTGRCRAPLTAGMAAAEALVSLRRSPALPASSVDAPGR